MARNISEAGIATGELVLANHVLQLTDAVRGDEAFNLHLTGGIQINDNFYPSGSGSIGDTLVLTGPSDLTFGIPNANTASYVTGSDVYGPFGSNSIVSASYAVSASFIADVKDTVRQDFTLQTLVPVNHNFDTQNILVQVYETTGANPVMIVPTSVTINDNNNVTVGFTSATTGYVVVSRGGFTVAGTIQNSISSSYAVTASHVTGISKQRFSRVLNGTSPTYTLTHNLNERLVVLSAYNPDFEQVVPTRVQCLDANNVFVEFTSNFSGSVVVLA
jgi:hypothetical protein